LIAHFINFFHQKHRNVHGSFECVLGNQSFFSFESAFRAALINSSRTALSKNIGVINHSSDHGRAGLMCRRWHPLLPSWLHHCAHGCSCEHRMIKSGRLKLLSQSLMRILNVANVIYRAVHLR
jgi:hypothetical protein